MKKSMLFFCFLLQTILFGQVTEYGFEEPWQESTEMAIGAMSADCAKWIAYYGNKAHVSNFYGYDPIVFYPQEHPILAPLLVTGKTLLGYLSFGDVGSVDFFYKEAKSQQLLLDKNPVNSDRTLIDIRNPKWEALLLGTIVPEILAEGFTGICIGNIDAIVNLEFYRPDLYSGMVQSALSLLQKIRMQFPGYKIMIDMKGLLHIGEQFVEYADMLCYEQLFTKQESKNLALRTAQEYTLLAKELQQVASRKEGIKVYTLDFWPEKEKEIIKGIYQRHRVYGFIPYVTENLLKLSKEPDA